VSASSPFAPYLPRDVLDFAATAPSLPLLRPAEGAVLFADVSGFTSLSERLWEKLGRTGAEVLTSILNRHFDRMVGEAVARGGSVHKFGGDAMTVLFEGEGSRAVERAVGAARAMQRGMAEVGRIDTPAGEFTLAMKVGIGAGLARILLFGDPARRVESVLEGGPVNESAEAEHHARAGDVVLSPSAAELFLEPDIETLDGGFVRVGAPPPPPRRTTRLFSPSSGSGPASPEIAEMFFPLALRSRIASGESLLLNEHRRVTTIFLRFPSLDYGLAESLDRLQRFFLLADEIVTRLGGIVVRADFGDKGSKLLVLFGAPVAVESAEERAARAIEELLRRAIPVVGTASAGLTAGAVFAGDVGSSLRREYTVMGDAVNLAARLMQRAEPGALLASEGLAADAPSMEWEGTEPFLVKGKSEPIRAFRLRSVERTDSASPQAPAAPAPARVVPRPAIEEPAAALLRRLLEKRESGGLRLVGPAGCGKSLLVDRLLAATVDCQASVHLQRLRPWEIGVPFAWGRKLLPELLGLPDDSPPGRLEVRLRSRLAGADDLSESDVVAALRLLGWREGRGKESAGGADLETQVAAMAALVERLAGDGATLFAIDGTESLDSLSLRVLEAIRTGASPRALLLAGRSGEGLGGELVEIPPFDGDEIRQFLALSLGDDRIDPKLTDFLRERSGGNPLHVEVLVREFQGSRLVRYDPIAEQWGLDPSRSADLLAESLESLLLHRLDTLPEGPRHLAKIASLLGDRFPSDVLDAIRPPGSESQHLLALAKLVEAGILEEAGTELLFPDSLLRSAIETSVPAGARGAIHLAAAKALDRSHRDRIDLRAEQWHRAGRPRQSIPLLERAGRAAAGQYLHRVALGCLENLRADFAQLPEEARHPGILRVVRRATLVEGEIRMLVGELDRAREVLLPSRGAAEAGDRSREVLGALDLLGQIATRQARFDEVLSHADLLLTAATELGSEEYQGLALLLRGSALARGGKLREAEKELALSIEKLRKTKNRKALGRALQSFGLCLYYLGRPKEALRVLTRALSIARRSGSRTAIGAALVNRSIAFQELGRWRSAEADLRCAESLLRAAGASTLLAYVFGNLNILAESGRNLDEAQRYSELHARCVVHLGVPADQIVSATCQAEVGALRGDAVRVSALLAKLEKMGLTELDSTALLDFGIKAIRCIWESGSHVEAIEAANRILAATAASDCDRRGVLHALALAARSEIPPADLLPEHPEFPEDEVLAIALSIARGADWAGVAESLKRVATRAAKQGRWLAVLEANDLLARFSVSPAHRRTARATISRIATRLGSPLWLRRAQTSGSGDRLLEAPIVSSIAAGPDSRLALAPPGAYSTR
jgi:class 3 adenylate cyclase/tetratricopeptide (TPR) repeat protein